MYRMETNRLDHVADLADVLALATCCRDSSAYVVFTEWQNSLDAHDVSDSTFAAMESHVAAAAEYFAAQIAATLAHPDTPETSGPDDDFPLLFILYGKRAFIELDESSRAA